MPNEKGGYLIHYVSEYYDPAKASEYNHEYYEAHKDLKGRSGKTLNDEGKVALYTVKKNINEQKTSLIDYSKSQRDEAIEEIQNEIASLKTLGKEERAKKKEELTKRIVELKNDAVKEKNAITEKYQNQVSDYKEELTSENESNKTNRASNTEHAQNKIDSLQAQIKNLP